MRAHRQAWTAGIAAALCTIVACGGSVTNVGPGTDSGAPDGLSPGDSGLVGDSATGQDSATDSGFTDSAAPDGSDSHAPTDSGDSATDSGDSATDASEAGPPDSGEVPLYHRPNDSQCQTPAPAGDCHLSQGIGMCSNDSQCTAGTNGRCNESNGGALFCSCAYDTCQHDTDCPAGQLCVCHGSEFATGDGNTCMPGNCRVDSDCGPAGYCSPNHGVGGGCGNVTGYYCHTASDQCVNDSDCTGQGLDVCAWSETDARWECQQEGLCA
jgi:hypothetical protein